MEGWVDLGGWLHTETVNPPTDGHHPSINRAWHRVTTLIKTNSLPISHATTVVSFQPAWTVTELQLAQSQRQRVLSLLCYYHKCYHLTQSCHLSAMNSVLSACTMAIITPTLLQCQLSFWTVFLLMFFAYSWPVQLDQWGRLTLC